MTVEELKKVAKEMGYNIIKIPEKLKKLPCLCGSKRINRWYRFDGNIFYKCSKCGRRSYMDRTERGAIKNWNWAVENNEFSVVVE